MIKREEITPRAQRLLRSFFQKKNEGTLYRIRDGEITFTAVAIHSRATEEITALGDAAVVAARALEILWRVGCEITETRGGGRIISRENLRKVAPEGTT